MAPTSKKSLEKTPSRPKSVMNLASKLKILNLIEGGEKIAAIARKFCVNESTIRNIRDNKDKIRRSAAGLGQHAKCLKVVRRENLEKMEEMLLVWIQDLVHKKIPLSTATIRTQAKKYHEYLNEKYGRDEVFNASKGWFENFKMRYSFHSLKFTGTYAKFLSIPDEKLIRFRSSNRRECKC